MTTKLLKEINVPSLFHEVGMPIVPEDVLQVASWYEAIEWFRRDDWYSLCDTARFHMIERVTDPNWNTRMGEVRTVVDSIAYDVLELSSLRKLSAEQVRRIADEFRDQLILCCIEIETSALHKFRFFERVVSWSISGHFTCGWDGHYPEGKIVVY